MWPATITSTHNSSSPPPPPTGGGGTIQTVVTASGQTPYRPFESPLHELEFRPNPFPSPEPPAPPPAALSPPLQIVGSQWTLSPPDEQRSETVRLMMLMMKAFLEKLECFTYVLFEVIDFLQVLLWGLESCCKLFIFRLVEKVLFHVFFFGQYPCFLIISRVLKSESFDENI